MVTNPKTATWTNPTQATDANGVPVAFDPSQDMAGIEIQLDDQPAVVVPAGVATSFDLTSLDAFKALSPGEHTLGLAIVTKEGTVGQFASGATFQRAVIPLAPTSLALA